MLKRNLLWFLSVSFSFAIIYVAWLFGFFTLLLKYDVSYLGTSSVALYFFVVLFLGIKVLQNNGEFADDELDGYWFVSDIFFSLGLLGTLIGLVYVFHGLHDLPTDMNIANIKPLLTQIAVGIATALYTTIVGIVLSNMIKVQLWILEKIGRINIFEKFGSLE